MIELRLEDGTRLDLRGDEIIAITYAVNDIASIETRQGVTSNEFNLPITDFNLQALGYPTNFNVNQDVNPFKKIPAEIYEEELRIAKGYIQITNPSISGNAIPVTFFGENAEWFNLIKGKSIRDLDLSEWRHVFNPSTIKASFENTEGYKYALIDRNGLNFLTGDGLSCQNFTLCTFQSTIAKAIINEIGFKMSGTLLNDPLYKKTVVVDTNSKFFALDNGEDRSVSLGTESTVYPAGTTDAVINFVKTDQFNSEPDNYSSGVFTAESNYLVLSNISLIYKNIGTVETKVVSKLQINGSTVFTATFDVLPGDTEVTAFSFSDIQLRGGAYYSLSKGDEVQVVISTNNDDIELLPTQETTIGTIGGVYGHFGLTVQDVAQEGGDVNIQATLPDIDQADFINEFVFDHNALVTVNLNTKTINFDLKRYSIEDSLDWSKIIDLSERVELSYTDLTDSYAQINDVRRTENDDVFINEYNNNRRIKYGDGQFTLENDFLEKREDLFESEFSPVFTISSLDQKQALPYVIGDKISNTYEVTEFASNVIDVSLESDLDFFAKTNPNTVWALITDSDNPDYERAYSVISIQKVTEYKIQVNYTFPTTATGLLRLVVRDEESDPRKLIDGGSYLIADNNDAFDSYNVTSILSAPEDSVNIIEMPYLYFWNPIVNKPTDENDLSLSYGRIQIPSISKSILEEYYEQTINILQKGKVLKASFRLNQVDIFNLDFNKLIYLNFHLNGQTVTGYFILNKIEEYSGNEDSTVVELIKI